MSWGSEWRSSSWYITLVVAMGTAMEAFTYQVIVPIMPFRLQQLGYTSPADVARLSSWLFLAYSAGILTVSIPFGYFFAAHTWRRGPLIIANMVVIGALLLGMLVKPYGVLVFTRFVMGAASTVIWTVGLALICENVPRENIGRQIGWAIAGVSIGSTLAAPISGALFAKFGWNAPFIFSIAGVGLDLLARLLVLEREQGAIGNDIELATRITSDLELNLLPLPSSPTLSFEQPTGASKQSTVTSVAVSDRSSSYPVSKTETPLWRILLDMGKSRRGVSGFAMTFIFGLTLGMQDPTLTLHVQTVWGKGSSYVGIIYLIAAVPTFISGPLAGHIADKYGAEWVIAPGLFLTLSFLPLLIPQHSIALFIVMFTFENALLATGIGPIGLEFAAAAKSMAHKGASEIHEFSAMNFVFAAASLIGALIGGEVYAKAENGWAAICWILFAFALISLPIPFTCTGDKPLYSRLRLWLNSRE